MITDPHLMPDFRADLEQALYRRASVAAPAPALRLPPVLLPRPTIAGRLALGAAVLVVALAVVLTSLPGKQSSHTAFAEPLILAQPTQAVPPGVFIGSLARQVLGPNANYTGSITVQGAGVPILLLKAQTGWCIDPSGVAGTRRAAAQVSCRTTRDLEQTGIASVGFGTYFAAIPPGSSPPTLILANGTQTSLSVSSLGVVTATGLHPGDRVIRHGIDGSSQTDVVTQGVSSLPPTTVGP